MKRIHDNTRNWRERTDSNQSGWKVLPAWFIHTVLLIWCIDLVLIVIGSVMLPLQHHAPWESSGVSHFVAYMGLGLLPMLLRPTRGTVVALVIGVVAFGGLMEWVQTFQPERFGTLTDALVNAAGVTCGVAVGWLLEKATTPILRQLAGRA